MHAGCGIVAPDEKWTHNDGYPAGETALHIVRKKSGDARQLAIAEYLEKRIADCNRKRKNSSETTEQTVGGARDFEFVSARSIFDKAREREEQNALCPVCGSRDPELVEKCAKEMIAKELFSFIQEFFAEAISFASEVDKPRYDNIYNALLGSLRFSFGFYLPKPEASSQQTKAARSDTNFKAASPLYLEVPAPAHNCTIQQLFDCFSSLLLESEDDVCNLLSSLFMPSLSLVTLTSGLTLLHVACASGKAKVAKYMAKEGFPSTPTLDGRYPIHSFVEWLVKSRAPSASLASSLASSPLHCQDDAYISLYESLLPGVDLNALIPITASKDARTLLHYAVDANAVCLARLLLSKKADVFAKNRRGVTILDAAIDASKSAPGLAILKHIMESTDRLDIGRVGQIALRSGE